MGVPLYVVAGLLLIAGLFEGPLVVAFQGVELLALGLLAADAWGIRQRVPLLNSEDKAQAAGGWVLLVGVSLALALLLPET